MQRILGTLLLLILPAVNWGASAPGQRLAAHFAGVEQDRVWQEPPNLLQNPGFEGDYFTWGGINEIQVAHGWTPWWRTRTAADPPAAYFQPEYKQANGYIYPNRVHGGAAAQQWFTFHATHQAGMYQQVFNVTPGTRYRFTIWAQVWSSVEDDPDTSVNPAYPNLQVGVDPTGNWDPWAGEVVWSGTVAFYDSWGQLSVEAVAQSTTVTVFMRSEPNFPVKHNDMYWDDALLVAVDQGPVPSPPTATAAVPPPPTATCAPAPVDWVTYHVQRGDTLYSLATSRGTTVEIVKSVNCLSATTIHTGQALLLPPLSATATPSGATASPTPVRPTATARPSASPTTVATVTKPPVTPSPTVVSPTAVTTATPVPVAAATATPTRPRPAIPPPFTPTAGPSPAPPTAAPSGGGSRPCGTMALGAGLVLLAGVFRFSLTRRER